MTVIASIADAEFGGGYLTLDFKKKKEGGS